MPMPIFTFAAGTILPMIDWDDAFDNSGYVADSEQLAERWAKAAAACRERWQQAGQARLDLEYGELTRCRLDLFTPAANGAGLIVFVHGGYWHMLDKSYWSQLAAAALAAGWSVAIPSYPLAPEVRIRDITRAIQAAIEFAASLVTGPIRLAGHSAGGHLVTRMVCADIELCDNTLQRLQKVVAISGIYDLRPLLHTRMNRTLQLDIDEAAAESPALLPPRPGVIVRCWVGAGERPEFLRQARLLGESWSAASMDLGEIYQPGKQHFSVIDGLAEPDSPLFRELIS